MNIIINDITILSELVGTINKADLDFMGITFHTIPMAIDKSQQSAAEDLKEADVLACHTLDQEEDTLWIAEHLSCDVGFGDLSIIRYALIHQLTLLTNDPVLTNKARGLGVEVVDVNYLKVAMEDNVVADEKQTEAYLARIFRHRPGHWNWFRSQHLQLGKIAALL